MNKALPNQLSLLRIALIPVLVIVFYLPFKYANVAATGLFILAAVTDWLDGYLARKWDAATPLGAFIDPVADKLLVVITALLVLQQTPTWYVLLPVMIIIGREVIISALREWMAQIGAQKSVKVSWIGKWKTTFQLIAIGCLIYHNDLFSLPVFKIGIAALYIATALTLWSMVQYLRAAWPNLTNKP